jgi:hypothetical protein
MTDSIEGGPPERRWHVGRTWLLGGAAVGVAAIVIAAVVVGAGSRGHSNPATPSAFSPSPAPTCSGGESATALRDFVRGWNRRDGGALAAALTPTTELDMSTPAQRALPPAVHGGLTSSQGIQPILRFVRAQWRYGEALSYTGVRSFAGGVNAIGLTATFADGSRQRMSEGKFVYDCAQAGFTHIVIVSAELAR